MVSAIHPTSGKVRPAPALSIGIIAWNEEQAMGPMLESLMSQSIFAELARRGLGCEVLCLVNGSTDRTAEVATDVFARQPTSGGVAASRSCRVVTIAQRGKINAWNLFVHSFSAREARYLFLMDADITIHNPETLWNMLLKLENNAEAAVAVDQPRKDIEFRKGAGIRGWLSAGASRLTRSAPAQLCAQLYCIRADTARNIYLPKDLNACDDGFIKALVCTDFLAHPVWPMRIQAASNAAHTFQAYTSLGEVFRNQKRQAIGQTIVHILVDDELTRLSPLQRSRMAETLRARDAADPDWLRKLICRHMKGRPFWRLYPGLLTARFRRLAGVGVFRAVFCLPAVLAGFVISIASNFAASRALRRGVTSYWPRAQRTGFSGRKVESRPVSSFTRIEAHPE